MRNDTCGVRTHGLAGWRLKPPPYTARGKCPCPWRGLNLLAVPPFGLPVLRAVLVAAALVVAAAVVEAAVAAKYRLILICSCCGCLAPPFHPSTTDPSTHPPIVPPTIQLTTHPQPATHRPPVSTIPALTHRLRPPPITHPTWVGSYKTTPPTAWTKILHQIMV